jgi:hypothetical protein
MIDRASRGQNKELAKWQKKSEALNDMYVKRLTILF